MIRRALNLGEKAFISLGGAALVVANPQRGDLVAAISEVTSGPALRALLHRVKLTDSGRDLLKNRPRLRSPAIDLHHLQATLPANTFGHAYASFMLSRGYSPDGRAEPRLMGDAEDEQYLLLRYREVHDLWHVLLGLPTTVLGELAQKAFEALQTGLPVCYLSVAVAGPVRLSPWESAKLVGTYIPWAVQCNASCRFLLDVKLEDMLEEDLEEVRRRLGIIKAPSV